MGQIYQAKASAIAASSSLVCLWLLLCACSAFAQPPAPFELSIEGLVVKEGVIRIEMKDGKPPGFDVVLKNVSGLPQPIFQTRNSWG